VTIASGSSSATATFSSAFPGGTTVRVVVSTLGATGGLTGSTNCRYLDVGSVSTSGFTVTIRQCVSGATANANASTPIAYIAIGDL
jgi:hypothetical protein